MEHVVPAGLGGWRTLPAASCEKCRKITHGFETKALRHVIGPGRYWLGIPASKKNKRPDFWPAYAYSDGAADQKVMIPISELPFFLCLPTFTANSAISGLIPPEHIPDDVDEWFIVTEDPVSLGAKLKTHGADYLSVNFDHLAFARMLAKIAVGYCVIEFGWNNFTPAVTPLILGDTNVYRDVISSSQLRTENSHGDLERRYEHDISHCISSGKVPMVCVRIDLFKNLAAPSYYVLAGALGGVTLRFAES